MTEKQLISLCIEQDRQAQKMLYERFSKTLYGICLRYARHNAEAQDMLQDSFIRIFKYLPTFEGKGSLEGWMRRITVHAALRTIKLKGHEMESYPEFLPDDSCEPDAPMSLRAEELLGYVRRLPDGYKAVFNMFAIEGFSHAEIAKELKIEESTSRSQLVKARKMLQNMIFVNEKNYQY
jgi:RNA polymerase sigma factor (sigma-70 family)